MPGKRAVASSDPVDHCQGLCMGLCQTPSLDVEAPGSHHKRSLMTQFLCSGTQRKWWGPWAWG